MDASIMDGKPLKSGAVACIQVILFEFMYRMSDIQLLSLKMSC